MAGRRKLSPDQKVVAFVLQATPEQLDLFYNKLMKELQKKEQRAGTCVIIAGSATFALGLGAVLVSQGALPPVIVTMANTVALNGISGINLLFGIRKLKRRLAIVEAALEARGMSSALVATQV